MRERDAATRGVRYPRGCSERLALLPALRIRAGRTTTVTSGARHAGSFSTRNRRRPCQRSSSTTRVACCSRAERTILMPVSGTCSAASSRRASTRSTASGASCSRKRAWRWSRASSSARTWTHTERGPRLASVLNLVWEARIVAGEPSPADDVSELRWFPRDEPPPPEECAFRWVAKFLHSANRRGIARRGEGLGLGCEDEPSREAADARRSSPARENPRLARREGARGGNRRFPPRNTEGPDPALRLGEGRGKPRNVLQRFVPGYAS